MSLIFNMLWWLFLKRRALQKPKIPTLKTKITKIYAKIWVSRFFWASLFLSMCFLPYTSVKASIPETLNPCAEICECEADNCKNKEVIDPLTENQIELINTHCTGESNDSDTLLPDTNCHFAVENTKKNCSKNKNVNNQMKSIDTSTSIKSNASEVEDAAKNLSRQCEESIDECEQVCDNEISQLCKKILPSSPALCQPPRQCNPPPPHGTCKLCAEKKDPQETNAIYPQSTEIRDAIQKLDIVINLNKPQCRSKENTDYLSGLGQAIMGAATLGALFCTTTGRCRATNPPEPPKSQKAICLESGGTWVKDSKQTSSEKGTCIHINVPAREDNGNDRFNGGGSPPSPGSSPQTKKTPKDEKDNGTKGNSTSNPIALPGGKGASNGKTGGSGVGTRGGITGGSGGISLANTMLESSPDDEEEEKEAEYVKTPTSFSGGGGGGGGSRGSAYNFNQRSKRQLASVKRKLKLPNNKKAQKKTTPTLSSAHTSVFDRVSKRYQNHCQKTNCL